MTKAEKAYKETVASIGCVICREHYDVKNPCELHHVGEGSGARSEYMLVGLCADHHRNGSTSLHGAGVKQFLRLFGLPTEYHLLELVNKYRAIDGK